MASSQLQKPRSLLPSQLLLEGLVMHFAQRLIKHRRYTKRKTMRLESYNYIIYTCQLEETLEHVFLSCIFNLPKLVGLL